MSGTQTTFLDNLTVAVRENPVAAALIGGGALWLLMGNETLKRAAGSASAAAAPLADIGARRPHTAEKLASSPPTVPEMDNGSSHVGETLRGAGSAASDAASDAAGTIKARFDEGVSYAHETAQKTGGALPGKETFERAQSSLSDLLERQPLVLGAIGLAVGAAVASAFMASDLENEWIGEFSDTVKADLNVRAGAVSQSVREASDTLKAEIQDVASESVDRLRQAGSSAADAAQNASGR
jgi:fructose-1,6-bisphosphatase/inositol monophosphatase family enzyme